MQSTKILAAHTLIRINEFQSRLAMLSLVCFLAMS